MDYAVEMLGDFVLWMFIIAISLIVGVYVILTNINTKYIVVQSVKQNIALDNLKEEYDQGYYRNASLLLDKYKTGKLTGSSTSNRYNMHDIKLAGESSQSITVSPTLGVPTEVNPYEYGQPYGFRHEIKFRVFQPFGVKNKQITIFSGRSGVNRGNYNTEGYLYQGTTNDIERRSQGGEFK